MKIEKKFTIYMILFALALQTACLKTRAQLNEDEPSHSTHQSQPISSTASSRKTPPAEENSYMIDEIKAEIARLTGRLETLERQGSTAQENTQNQTTAELQKLNSRIDELEKAQIELLSKLKVLQVTTSTSPNELFKSAQDEFGKKNYQKSIDILNLYLNTENPKKQADATFLRGEAYFKMQEYKRAIMDYSKFAENQFGPTHKKNPEALFQIAASFEKLGMKDESGVFLKDLIDRFPASTQAKLAQQKTGSKKSSSANKKTPTPEPPSKRKPSSLEDVNSAEDGSSEEE